ncbi:MAG: hypothetical protein IIA44_09205 [Acidobacteria bacterium]|nr:hypothetical protein [Acidobacteriota bacterium]
MTRTRVETFSSEAGIRAAALALRRNTVAGELILIDEILTPDSSRYWPADAWATGTTMPSFDKQPVRDWLEGQDWDKRPPAPPLPEDIVADTRSRYIEAFERLTGRSFGGYVAAAGGLE